MSEHAGIDQSAWSGRSRFVAEDKELGGTKTDPVPDELGDFSILETRWLLPNNTSPSGILLPLCMGQAFCWARRRIFSRV